MTLVEVMIATVVMVVVLLGILTCTIKAYGEVFRATIVARETSILDDKVEEMRATQFSVLAAALAKGTADPVNQNEIKTSNTSLAQSLFAGSGVFVWQRQLVSSTATFLTVRVSVWLKNSPSQVLTVVTQISSQGLSAKPAA